ncbi:hypothetical protein GCM10007880_31720 [Mesorhizobium amorphae]|nr:hypothetical protein GCM10007880_31720 [Mesorhizobium amorphae]
MRGARLGSDMGAKIAWVVGGSRIGATLKQPISPLVGEIAASAPHPIPPVTA